MADYHGGVPDLPAHFDHGLCFPGGLDDSLLPHIPARRGLMLLLTREGKPVVLLPAADMRSRLGARMRGADDEPAATKMPDLSKVTAQVLWTLTAGDFETDLRFLDIAAALWPQDYQSMLAWKSAWFVHVDLDERFPLFQRSRSVFQRRGRYFGPFPTGKSADAYINLLVEIFDLCRESACGRAAPNGRPCPYAQMGKCLSVCDGTVSLEDYARHVAAAVHVAEGHTHAIRDQLQSRMRAAAEQLMFEAAASFKAKLQKLDDLAAPALADVRAAEQFAFIILQRGRGRRQIKTFLACRGSVAAGPAVAYPPKEDALQSLLQAMAAHAAAPPAAWDEVQSCRLALTAQHLYGPAHRRALLVRWTPDLNPAALAAAIESAAEPLHLKTPPQ
ncbi:MAG: hypothetical protein LLG01_16575 [Planctomycetaceae bacterium]|nr:hypothetical protein [Planctomycetaceae bacterium]